MICLYDLDIMVKTDIESIRQKYCENANAKTFNSAYIWSDAMGIKVHLEHDMYAFKNSSHGSCSWNFPVGAEQAKISFINELLKSGQLKLLKLCEDDVAFIHNYFPDKFDIEEAPEDSEYIYDAEEHAYMAGKKFLRLRRTVNKFKREHSLYSEILTQSNLQIAYKIMSTWGKQHRMRHESNTSGSEVSQFIIDHFNALGLFGVLIYIDSIPSAVSIGYRISSDTCDIAETKFIPDIRDLGYIATEEFIKSFQHSFRYFNDEEDMGILGLREFKMQLRPCRMNVLYNAYLKGGKSL